jgi:hypothetical protein
MTRRLPIFYRDAMRRSAFGDLETLLLFAIAAANADLLEGFR